MLAGSGDGAAVDALLVVGVATVLNVVVGDNEEPSEDRRATTPTPTTVAMTREPTTTSV